MKYQVFDNNKPAEIPISKYKEWHNSIFNTFEEAQKHAKLWMGDYYNGIPLKLGEKRNYSGYQDCIEIREIDN